MLNRGSEWRKWDLHFHTPSSYDYKDKTVTNEDIINILFENGIAVVAITDHHLIDIDRIKELQRIGQEKGIVVLPGIEFLSDARGREPIHFIGIFSENCNIKHIWGQLQNRTNISKIEGEGKAPNEVYCNLEDTIKLIHELGGITTIHAGDKTNSIENITHSLPHGTAQKTEIAHNIGVYELGKVKDQEGYKKVVFPNIGRYIPMIICSDNHNIKDYTLKENCWIKADTSFEGLKQIIYEPEERVKIQLEMPEVEKLDKLMIEKVQFSSSNHRFTPTEIYFNKNLNVIIGGKSSGKSILLYQIAKTLYANTDDSVLKYKDVEEQKEKYFYDLTYDAENREDENFDFTVTLYSGNNQSFKSREQNLSILPSITYISQNYLSNLVDKSRKTGATLNKIIRDLMLELPEYKSKYDAFIVKLREYDEQRNRDIDRYFSLKNNLKTYKKDLSNIGDAEALQKEISTNKEKIKALNSKSTLEEQEKYDGLIKQLAELGNKEQKIKTDIESISHFQSLLKSKFEEIRTKKQETFEILNTEFIKKEYSERFKFIDDIEEVVQMATKSLILAGESEEKTVSILEIEKIENEKKDIYSKLKPLQEKQENHKQVEALQESIRKDEEKVESIGQLLIEVEKIKKIMSEIKLKVFKDFRNNYELYEQMIKDFEPRVNQVESETNEIEISASVKYQFPKFRRDVIEEFFDGRSFDNSGVDYLYQKPNEHRKSAISEIDYAEIQSALETFFAKVDEGILSLKGKYANDKAQVIKKIMQDFFFDYWTVKSQGDDIHTMSTGKASLVLLKLIIKLSIDNSPILIDQAEDNLDNRSISNDLVKFLKEKKKERQIILVTHNPNIVVNADAENIIVANQRGQSDTESTSVYQFDYINGSLENTLPKDDSNTDMLKSMGVREHIAEIVEGGKEAFKKREEKYGFKSN